MPSVSPVPPAPAAPPATRPRTAPSPPAPVNAPRTTGSRCTRSSTRGTSATSGFVRDGAPVVLPTLYARCGERLYVHGSTGSRPLRGAAGDPGLAVCLTVTHVDGLVLARSAFHHSINYRSVVVHGTAHQVTDPAERALALDAIVEQAVPGRSGDSRRANARELAATAVLRLDLREVSAKVRSGGPNDEPQDAVLPHWSGVVPVARTYAAPDTGRRPRPVDAAARVPRARQPARRGP